MDKLPALRQRFINLIIQSSTEVEFENWVKSKGSLLPDYTRVTPKAHSYENRLPEYLESMKKFGGIEALVQRYFDDNKKNTELAALYGEFQSVIRSSGALEQRDGRVSEKLSSRSAIILCVESKASPLEERNILGTERHLTIQLSPEQIAQLEKISRQISDATTDIESIQQAGEKVWSMLKKSQGRLEELFSRARESAHPQPIAWTGKADLLVKIFRPLLAAKFGNDEDANDFISVSSGSHYFNPIREAGNQFKIPGRSPSVQIKEVADLNATEEGGKRGLQLIESLGKDILILRHAKTLEDVQRVLDLNKSAETNYTRAIVSLGVEEPSVEKLQDFLNAVPFISFGGRSLNDSDLATQLANQIERRMSLQTMPCILSGVRSLLVEKSLKEQCTKDFIDALFWSHWSWVHKPLFAESFDQTEPAAYPHLMDLRQVASKEWYYDRKGNIPEIYYADSLAKSNSKPEERFHFYITGSGGTGKSCFIRYIFEQFEQQNSVFPIWYRVDAPSSDWKNVEKGIKSIIEKKIRKISKDYPIQWKDLLPEEKNRDLRYYLQRLLERLQNSELKIHEIAVFIDQLERTFESGDNPDAKRLKNISDEVTKLLQEVKADRGIRIFIASRKQYLPDFINSFKNALDNKLHFNVLQNISDLDEQARFVEKILTWCKNEQLVDPKTDFEPTASLMLTSQVKGHPLNMMLALIRVFSTNSGKKITLQTFEKAGEGNRPWENLFNLDLQLFAKDEVDWYFLLSMAYARTEIERFEEVWWYLRLIDPTLTKKVEDLGPAGMLERLWLLGHLGRTIYVRQMESGIAKFLEFFHANLRDYLIKEVMNRGGEILQTGRRGGTPPVWRALDHLARAAHDWDQSQQLLASEDIQVMMEHRNVLIEKTKWEAKESGGETDIFYLLFLRDPADAQNELCQAAKECFIYSAIVHDNFGRWAFENIVPTISERITLSKTWVQRSDVEGIRRVLLYFVETDQPECREFLSDLIFDLEKIYARGEIWREIGGILLQPMIADRYRPGIMVSAIQRDFQRENKKKEYQPSSRFKEFILAACNHERDDILKLMSDCYDRLASIESSDDNGLTDLLRSPEVFNSLLGDIAQVESAAEVAFREADGKVLPKIQLILGTRIIQYVPENLPSKWRANIAEKLGIPLPNLDIVRRRDEDKDGEKKDYFEYGIELLIKGESVALDNFFPERYLIFESTMKRPHAMDLGGGEITYNYTFQDDIFWVKEKPSSDADAKKHLSTLEAMEIWLGEEFKYNVDRLFDFDLMAEWLNELEDVVDINRLFQNSSLPALRRIIVNLVEESVPFGKRRDEFIRQLQQLLITGGDIDVVTQKLREHFRNEICASLANDQGKMAILIFDEQLEDSIKNRYLEIKDGSSQLRLPPELALKISSTLIIQTNKILKEENILPVLACEPLIRRPVSAMVKRFDKRVRVLSYTELSTDVLPEIKYQIASHDA